MRHDNIGLFWEDVATERGKVVRVQPPIPETGWHPPTYFPNLRAAKAIAIDVETYDPDLTTLGPGWARGVGHIVGISVGVEGGAWYFPIRHEIQTEDNLDPEQVLAWLRDTLGNPNQPKVGANLAYDIGWLRQEGVIVRGDLVDVQFAEALLNESSPVALEALAQKYLNEGKESSVLYKWCSDFYGGPVTGIQRKNIYRSPPCLTGAYAESDVRLPLRLVKVLYPLLAKEGLLDIFRMENALIYLLQEMRFAGVTVNTEKAARLQENLIEREAALRANLYKQVGFELNINAADDLARAFDTAKIPYNRTQTGRPSFTKEFMKAVKHPLTDCIADIRKLAKLRGTFIEGYILNAHVKGKVYGNFHCLRGDENGTRSGRFSSSDPNLQNLPSRDDELAPLIRGLFIPDAGHACWRRHDYSQIEYRFLAHFALGGLSEEVRSRFCDDPNTDYHELTQSLVKEQTGIALSRKHTKNINFGLAYGMGVQTLAANLGLSIEEALALFDAYHKGAPFVRATMNFYQQQAARTGVISTILGRRSRFDLFEPADFSLKAIALPYNIAQSKYGRIQRAHTHKALNRLLQGSAADLMKKAMLKCWEDGVFDVTGVPRLTVHDELDFSVEYPDNKGFEEMQRILETAIPLRVPVKADGETGPDWGHLS